MFVEAIDINQWIKKFKRKKNVYIAKVREVIDFGHLTGKINWFMSQDNEGSYDSEK